MKTNATLDAYPANGSPARFVAAILGLLLLVLGHLPGFAAQPVEIPLNPGIAPVPNVGGGFGIEGDLLTGNPLDGTADWTKTNVLSTGASFLNNDGSPIDPTVTFHRVDHYGAGNDTCFSGSKFDADPSAWKWVNSPTSDKTDINNALIHIARDSDNHVWAVIAGDRLSVNGSAYLDVEFLQKPLWMTNYPAAGSFYTGGLNKGRTTNDFVLSFNFNGGGSKPSITLWQWKAVGSSFDYVDVTSSSLPTQVYGADNTNAAGTFVPWGAFGQYTYPDALQFVEAAIDLTALVLNFSNPSQTCADSLAISTIFMKTKASSAPDAELKDLVDPIQLSLTLGPGADAGADKTNCFGGAVTTFTVTGTAQPGFSDLDSMTWTVVGNDPTVSITSGNTCSACDTLTANVEVTGADKTVELELTAIDKKGCVKTDRVKLTVKPLFNCTGSITGPTMVVAGSTGITYTGPSGDGQTGYLWSVDPSTGIAIKNGEVNKSSVVLDLAPDVVDPFALTLTFNDKNGCVQSCTYPVTVLASGDLCDMTGSDAVCVGSTGIHYTITPPPGLPGPFSYAWNLVNDGTTAAAFASAPTSSSTDVTVNAGNVAGSYTVSVTITYGGGSTAEPCSFSTIVNPNPDCLIGGPQTICPFSIGNQYGYAGDASKISTYSWSIGGTVIGTGSTVSVDGGACHAQFTLRLDVTDNNGCKNFCSIEVTANDTVPPLAPANPPDFEGQCAGDIPAATSLSATDNCDGTITASPVDSGHVPDALGCGYTINRTWTFTDRCGNTSTATQKIHIKDTNAPLAPANPPDFEGQCAGDIPAATSLSATDNCDGTITASPVDSGHVPDALGCGYTINRTWTFTDRCGNTSTATQKIHIKDTNAPLAPANPPDFEGQCAGDIPAATSLSATDNCDGTITASPVDSGHVPDALGCGYTINRTWTFTDRCGNTSTATQKIHIKDTNAPLAPANPPDFEGQCAGDIPAATSLSATDNCDGTITASPVDSGHVPDALGCGYTINRTWTFTDRCGNTSTATQKIHIKDTNAPLAPANPPDFEGQCAGDIPAATSLSATDNCDGTITASPVDSGHVPDALGCGYTINRTWTFTDRCGNTSTATQKIHIKDTNAPLAPANPPDFEGQCAGDIPAATSLSATDNCDGTITASPVDSGHVPDALGCGYTINRTWTFTDRCGNTSTATQKIHIKDTNAPLAPANPPDFEGQCAGDIPAATSLSATDNCDGTITASPVDSGHVPDALGCGYTINRTWTFTDRCGNTSTATQKIHIKDTNAPLAPANPPDFEGQCAGDIPAATSLSATDNCDGTITASPVDSGHVPDALGCGYTINRTWTFTDRCGNTSTATQKIHIKDTNAPSISKCPGKINAESCDAVLNLPISTSDTSITETQFVAEGGAASDSCSAVTVSYKDSYVSEVCPISILRTFTVKDACGNATTCTQEISFTDTLAPTIGCPVGQELSGCDTTLISPAYSTTGSTITLDAFKALGGTADDRCGLQTTVAYKDKAVATEGCQKAKVERTFTVKDICGNPASCTQVIIVKDTTPPVIDGATLPTGGDLGCTLPPNDATIEGQVKATDNCSGTVTVDATDKDVVSGCDVTRTVTITAIDACGNKSNPETVTYKFTRDNGTPVVGLPAHQAYYCPGDDVMIAPPSATDDCDVISMAVTVSNAAGTVIGNYAYASGTWNPEWPAGNKFILSPDAYGFAVLATDKCGNTGSGFFKINVLNDCTTHCTFTQGFYGNNSKGKGRFAWMSNSYTKSGLVNALLGTDGIVIGTESTGKYLKIGQGEADCIDARLPAGGPSAALTAGFKFSDADTCAITVETGAGSIPLDKQGRKFRNNMLGQTITLALNLKLDPTLTVFKLESTSLCTLGGNGGISSYTIPASVLTKLGSNNTVQDLLDLANKALGGDASLSGILSDIGSAVGAINEAFDECRVAVPCNL